MARFKSTRIALALAVLSAGSASAQRCWRGQPLSATEYGEYNPYGRGSSTIYFPGPANRTECFPSATACFDGVIAETNRIAQGSWVNPWFLRDCPSTGPSSITVNWQFEFRREPMAGKSCEEPSPGQVAARCGYGYDYRSWSNDVPNVPPDVTACGAFTQSRASVHDDPSPYRAITCAQTACPPGRHWWAGRCVSARDIYQRPEVCPRVGDVSPSSGLFRKELATDFNLGGNQLALTYDDAADPTQFPPLSEAGDLGDNWFLSTHRRVARNGPNTIAVRGNGELVSFHETDAGLLEATTSNGQVDRVSTTPSGLLYRSQSEQTLETFDADGRLTGWVTRDGRRFTGSVASGNLVAIRDDSGRGLDFSYRTESGRQRPLLERISSADGAQALTATYAGSALVRLARNDGSAQQLDYQNGRLTRLIDEHDAGFASFAYADGRLASSELADGVGRHAASYAQPPRARIREVFDAPTDTLLRYHEWEPPVGATVSTPNQAQTGYTFTAIAAGPNSPARVRLAGVSQPAGAGCGPASSHIGYDAFGNVSSRDDFNGHRTCYAHDSQRNLELRTVEGLATGADCDAALSGSAALPAGVRKVSTEWHPDWDVVVRRAEPGKITTWVYNGQPNGPNSTAACAPATALLPDGKPIAVLCHVIEAATTDPTGADGFAAALQLTPPRRVSYTYDATGRLLTEDGPRTDVVDVTTYAYYDSTSPSFRPGDLKSVTDAVGKTTRFTRYDSGGRLLELIAPNGLVTTHTYDLRGQRITSTVGSQRTTTSYDAVGQPTSVRRPDGSWTAACYDASHRLVGTTNSRGTTVDLQLDAAGNVTARTVKSGGAVREQSSFLFDVLGRLSRIVLGASATGGGSAPACMASAPAPTGGAGGGAGGAAGGAAGGSAATSSCTEVLANRRESVCQRWRCDRQDLQPGQWTGASAQCVGGDMPQARANALKLTNLYRFLADLPAVSTSEDRNGGAQECALMMTANNAVSFSPPATWACYAPRAATAASQSLICSGTAATRCVDLQMSAFGSTNSNTLGGRRWVLSNDLGTIGIGSTSSHACHWVVGSGGNAGKAWVAWPPPGPVPLAALRPSSDPSVDQVGWSVQGYSANVANATVTVTDQGQPLPVTVSTLLPWYGSPSAIKFVPDGWVAQAGHTYEVNVSGGSLGSPISYSVEVVDCP